MVRYSLQAIHYTCSIKKIRTFIGGGGTSGRTKINNGKGRRWYLNSLCGKRNLTPNEIKNDIFPMLCLMFRNEAFRSIFLLPVALVNKQKRRALFFPFLYCLSHHPNQGIFQELNLCKLNPRCLWVGNMC